MVNVQAWVSMLILLKRKEASTCKQPRMLLFVVRCTQLITTHPCRHVFHAPFLFFYVLWPLYCWKEWARKGRKMLLIRNVRLHALQPIQTSQTLWILPQDIQFCFRQKLDLLLIVWYRIPFWLQITETDTNDVSLYLQDGEKHFQCIALLWRISTLTITK